ncbi:hypothetical protein NIES2104_57030 [Leptolyngbya sp. NIES-2104]|nr:hypothetical protein NIES2104_57030 [Leptolyngbya sp. NIES-2104]
MDFLSKNRDFVFQITNFSGWICIFLLNRKVRSRVEWRNFAVDRALIFTYLYIDI